MSTNEPTSAADLPSVTLPALATDYKIQDPEELQAQDIQPTKANQTICNRFSLNWRCINFSYTKSQVGEFVFDLIQVLASVTDVVLDIIVAQQLYNEQLYTLFGLSLTVFFLAQTSYAMLFAAHWGDESPGTRKFTLLMLCVWPFAQLVPVFGWIESFHFKPINQVLEYFDLDLSKKLTLEDLTSEYAFKARFEAKLLSHSGLLLEAVVEALPQSMIQLTAVFMSDNLRDSPVNLLSILFSTFVIASKGYLVSQSIFKSTFMFNCATIAADVFGAFAVLTWLANGLFVDLSGPNELEWAMLIALGVLLGLLSVCCFMLLLAYTINHFIEWHLKRNGCNSAALSEVHATRSFVISHTFLMWGLGVVAVVPCIVVGFMLRLSSVPLLILNSFMSNYNEYPTFFKRMTRFLGSGIDKADTLLRKKIAISFFSSVLTFYIHRVNDFSSRMDEYEWLKQVHPIDLPLLYLGADARGVQSFSHHLSAVVVDSGTKPDDRADVPAQSAKGFAKLQSTMLGVWEKRISPMWKHIIRGPFRSYIAVRFLCPVSNNAESFLAVYLHLKNNNAGIEGLDTKRVLYIEEMRSVSPLKERWIELSIGMKLLIGSQLLIAVVQLLGTVFVGIVLLPCVLLGLMFPIVDVAIRSVTSADTQQPGSSLAIPTAFTVCYSISLLIVMISWMYVRREEYLLTSVGQVPVPAGLKQNSAELIKELHRRHRLITTAAKLHETLDIKLGQDVMSVVSEILGPADFPATQHAIGSN